MKDLASQTGTLAWDGTLYRTLLRSEDSGGALSIVDSLSPVGSGPPRHVHHAEDETFVMLSGTCKLWIAGQERLAGPGDSVFVPRGTEHSFVVVGTEPSRHLVILTPGGFEGFFAEMAAGQLRIPQDMATIGAAAARHNLSFTGPPLEPQS
ncbi:cupin domain-containing protein [Maliponia aquimaris]|uniref:Quercetin 2,3-dioxygenase n=1 Tax=Maliponia aquimaris TaxID=1673631 RepID=A0A238L4W3_9RHOB|nr:cupin domain-containing protein [Maliponia aquimaris]SMX50115.1 Quercetin 2,3-dioxygenase [Maliponia aquimaris]